MLLWRRIFPQKHFGGKSAVVRGLFALSIDLSSCVCQRDMEVMRSDYLNPSCVSLVCLCWLHNNVSLYERTKNLSDLLTTPIRGCFYKSVSIYMCFTREARFAFASKLGTHPNFAILVYASKMCKLKIPCNFQP